MTEQWKPVESMAGVEASDLGRIRVDGIVRKLNVGANGYLQVGIGKRTVSVHRLVAEAFHGPSPLLVRHRDDVKLNNAPSNLAYGTDHDNALDLVANGLNPRARRTECRNGHPYNEENTYITREGARACRRCNAASHARLQERKKASRG